MIAKLDEMEEFLRLEDESWDWVELRGSVNRADHREDSPDSRSKFNESGFENKILGFVKIGSKLLVLSPNARIGEKGF